MNFVLTGATLIDGTGANPVSNSALHIQDGRVAWVGSADNLPSNLADVPQQDVAGKFIIPGLIDAHVHVCWNGKESVLVSIERDRDYLLLEAVETLRKTLSTGTTTVRDIGGHYYLEMSLRDGIDKGFIVGPRMKVSGRIIAMTGGHAHFIAREADGPDEIRKAAREQLKAGADVIKVMATGWRGDSRTRCDGESTHCRGDESSGGSRPYAKQNRRGALSWDRWHQEFRAGWH